MKSYVRLAFVLGLSFLASACAHLGEDRGGVSAVADPAVVLSDVAQAEYRNTPKSVWVDGKLATLYLDDIGRVAFKMEGRVTLLDEDAPVKMGKYISLYRDGQNLYAFWWSHEDAKALYSKVSTDGGKTFHPVQQVQTAHGVLPPYELTFAGSDLGIVYGDERYGDRRIFFNRSTDHGVTWNKQDVPLDSFPTPQEAKAAKAKGGGDARSGGMAFEPHLVQAEGAWIATWQERLAGPPSKDAAPNWIFRIVARTSVDHGSTWGKEVEIYRGEALPASVQAISAGGQAFLVGDLLEKGVVLFRSGDAGKTWANLGAAPGSEKYYNSQVKVAVEGDRLYAVFSSKVQGQKNRIHAATFSLSTKQWLGAVVRMDVKPFELTEALNPDINVLASGVAVAAWEDYRGIRPNIYVNYTTDGGKTWKGPAAVWEEGRYNTFFPDLEKHDGKLWVFAERYSNDERQATRLVADVLSYDAKTQTLAGMFANKPALSPEAKAARLKARAEGFWSARVKKQYAEQWDYYDFAYRAATSRKSFEQFQGNIVYHSFEIEDVKVEDNVGKVTLKFNFEVPKTTVGGDLFSRPPADGRLVADWVWVYDDWYLVHQTAMGNRELFF